MRVILNKPAFVGKRLLPSLEEVVWPDPSLPLPRKTIITSGAEEYKHEIDEASGIKVLEGEHRGPLTKEEEEALKPAETLSEMADKAPTDVVADGAETLSEAGKSPAARAAAAKKKGAAS